MAPNPPSPPCMLMPEGDSLVAGDKAAATCKCLRRCHPSRMHTDITKWHHAAPTTLCKCPWFMFMGTRMHAVPVFQLACPLWLSGVMCNISAVFTQIEQTRHRLASQIVTKVGLEALWLQHADEKKKKHRLSPYLRAENYQITVTVPLFSKWDRLRKCGLAIFRFRRHCRTRTVRSTSPL